MMIEFKYLAESEEFRHEGVLMLRLENCLNDLGWRRNSIFLEGPDEGKLANVDPETLILAVNRTFEGMPEGPGEEIAVH